MSKKRNIFKRALGYCLERLVSVREDEVAKWARAGAEKLFKEGGRVLITSDEVAKWASSQVAIPKPGPGSGVPFRELQPAPPKAVGLKWAPIQWQVKVWGATRCVAKGPAFEVWDLIINKGGYCSRHYHRKWNQFLVVEGELVVEEFVTGGTAELTPGRERTLRGGVNGLDVLNVAPGTIHRFVATSMSRVVEVYWTDEIDPADIVRYDEGGML
jgi:quercetin dioxygenase-like cupin family protein